MKWGLMLVNLGTPDAPTTAAVRSYLDEFFRDPRVIDIHPILRWLLRTLVILPFRSSKSAEAYHKIWTKRGSPLLFHGLDLVEKLQRVLGTDAYVQLAMRYGNPSIAHAFEQFRAAAIDQIVVFPMFPQYSSAASGSGIEEIFVQAGRQWNIPTLQFVPPYFDHPSLIAAFADVAQPILAEMRPDMVVMSFHGLPERHIRKSDESEGAHCLRSEACCNQIVPANRNCYRAQCFATARALAAHLTLMPNEYRITFQSRLGRTPWIKPYTDLAVRELAERGVKRVAVMCPAFVADCLETIEEIGMRAQEDFLAHGGEQFRLIPSLNSEDVWVQAIVNIMRDSLLPILPVPYEHTQPVS